MASALAEPAASIDDALYKYCGSSAGWESATEYIYGSASNSSSPHYAKGQGVCLQSVQPLPPAFTSQYNEVRYKSFMGLFPEISRAWLTVDSKLCLWGYSAPSTSSAKQVPEINRANDFYVYEGFQQIIVSVALVRARPGVFVDHVQYLMAVATPVDVTLLGVTFSPNGELSLVPTQISVATDNVLMLKIVSTSKGRIFMAGADGSLHEFAYESRPTSGLLDLLSGRPAKRARKLIHNASPLVHYVVPAAIKSFFSRGDELVDLAVDSHRKSLYTLSQNGCLTVYDITADASTRMVRSVDITHESRHLVSFSFPSGSREYVSIHAVSPRTSKTVHLIVVTSFGERIYFTTLLKSASPIATAGLGALTSHKGGGHKNSHSFKTKSLRCVGYRPSPDRSSTRSSRPCVHIAWCAQGAAIFADLRENDPDRLITLYPDASVRENMSAHGQAGSQMGPHPVEVVFETSLGSEDDSCEYERKRRGFPAQTSAADNGGFVSNSPSFEGNRTFAIASITNENPSIESETTEWPLDPPAQFWVLTSSAVNLYELVRPVDHLRDILAAGGGSDSSIQQFFAQHGTAESCAMCLEIAISHPALLHIASRVFYTHGSDERFDSRQANLESEIPSNDGVGIHIGGANVTKRRSQAIRRPQREDMQGNRSSLNSRSFDVGRPTLPSAPMTRFSGAHDGASLYLAKVVHPLWNQFITSNRDPRQYQCLAFSKDYISQIRDKVFAFVSFLETYNPDEMLPARVGDVETPNGLRRDRGASRTGSMRARRESGRLSSFENTGHHEERGAMQDDVYRGSYGVQPTGEARRAEAVSIIALKDLGIRIVEGLALLMILSDHQLHRLVPCIPEEIQEFFVEMRLCDLVAAEVGVVVSASLIEAIFSSYSDSTNAVSNVGRILQERCPSYFGDSDVTLHRGLALLREAMSSVMKYGNTGSGETSGAGNDYNMYNGLIQKDSAAASAWISAQNLAEEAATVLKTVPERIFDIPTICSDFKILKAIPALVDVALTIGRVSESAGNHTRANIAYGCIFEALRSLVHESEDVSSEANGADNDQLDQLRQASLRVAFSAKSEVFLKKLYGFLLESKHGEEHLLQNPSPGIEVYLEQAKALDLLWRFCARHMRHLEAAMILLNLAEREEPTSLVDRLNYLSCALHNAKTAVSKGDARAESMLTEISDFMDVAKVQLRVRDELQHRDKGGATDTTLEELDSSILGLSVLFKYARRYELHEACLDIFRCGSYRDDAYVRVLWSHIVEKEARTPALLRKRMLTLGQEFYPSDVAFPVSFIVQLLEKHAYVNRTLAVWKDATGWVSKSMMEIGVPLGEIVDAYRMVIENPQQCYSGEESWSWSDEMAQLHIMKATECAVGLWAQENGRGDGQGVAVTRHDFGRRSFLSEAEKVLRAISLCKSRLCSMSSVACAELIQRFDSLEKMISPLTQ